jgi:choline dehydrogenase-like flavoprotein
MAGRMLRSVGCAPSSIFTTPLRGTHPCATVRIGELLSTDLETSVRNLYVCDASVFPEALARPTVLTIIALARRLAQHLAPTVRSWDSAFPGPDRPQPSAALDGDTQLLD